MLADIQRLSIAERIQLAEDIWDTIARDPDALPITDAQREELDHRLNAMQQTAQKGVSWQELKARLTSR